MLRYKVRGNVEGPLMVFISGAGVGKWMWKRQQTLETLCRCVYFDLPGHGENVDEPFKTIKSLAEEVRIIIKAESKSGKAIVVGHSIGAQTTLYMLEHCQDVLSGAIVVSALNHPMKYLLWTIRPMLITALPLAKYRWFANAQAKALNIPHEWLDTYYEDSVLLSFDTLDNIMKANMSFDFSKRLDTNIKVMILHGEKEKGIMSKSANKTCDLIDNVQLQMVKEAAHGIPYEQSEWFNACLVEFVKNP